MKYRFLMPAFLFLCMSVQAQTASVEKSVFGIQTGFLGLWVNNEARLSSQFAFRSEFGLAMGFSNNGFGALPDLAPGEIGYIMVPHLSAEPRWYYNLQKRVNRSASIKGNSGNFFAVKVCYFPDWFVISNSSGLSVPNQLQLIPKWGIRRQYGSHFNFEAGAGLGYVFVLERGGVDANDNKVAELHLRIGYTF